MDLLEDIIVKALKEVKEEKAEEEAKAKEEKKYLYFFSKKKYLRNHPEVIPLEKSIIEVLGGDSWQMQCDGKEVTPIGSKLGICYGKETNIFPYYINLKDCIKRKVQKGEINNDNKNI